MSEIIKRVELTYRAKDGTLASTLTAVESFRGHTADGSHFVGAYVHTDDGDDGASICLKFASLKLWLR